MVISQQDLSILYIYLYLFAKDNMKYTDYQVNMISISMLLGKRIKELRESKNIKQVTLADMIDIEPTNLSKIEKGNINKILLFLKIGKFYDRRE